MVTVYLLFSGKGYDLHCFLPLHLDRDSGLAARRLKALRTKLAEELVNKRTAGGNEDHMRF
jgi:hypothetical protein